MSKLDKPDKEYPIEEPCDTFESPMPLNIPDVSIRGEAWDQLAQNRGIRFIHKVAAPCPNMKRLVDSNHEPDCPYCDGSQILYVQENEIWGTFSNNTLEKMFEIQGVWEIGTAVISFPTAYPNGDQADFNVFDKLISPDFQIRLSDLKEYKPTQNNKMGSKYPIINVCDMTSVVDGAIKKYVQGVDFNIVAGEISWVTGREPRYDDIAEIGEVLSITYSANPVYNVLQTLHEIRASQQMVDGKKIARRLPQQVLVKRDFLFKPDNKES